MFVATIALFLGINAFTTGIWGAPPDEALDSLFPNDPDSFWRLTDGTVWRYENIGIFVTTLVVTGLLFLLFQKTRFGLAMRGVASNGESAPPRRHPDRPHPRRLVGHRRRPRRARRRDGRRAARARSRRR